MRCRKIIISKYTLIAVLLAAGALPLMFLDYAHFPFSDGAEHGAAVRALMRNMQNPGDPLLPGDITGSPRYVPSLVALALAGRILDLNIFSTLTFGLITGFLLFMFAVMVFSNEYFQSRRLSVYCLLCVLFLWGSGWTGANAYMFSALLYTAYFPSVVSFSLSLVALAMQLHFMRLGALKYLFAELVLGALAFTNHPLTGCFFCIASLMLFIEKKGLHLSWVSTWSILCAASVLSACAWPYTDFITTVLNLSSGKMASASDYAATRNYLHSEVLLRAGPAMLGIPFLAVLTAAKCSFFLTGGFAVFTAIYVLGHFLHINLTERFVFFSVFILQLTFARFLAPECSRIPHITKNVQRTMIAVIAAGIGIQCGIVYTQFIQHSFSVPADEILPKYRSPLRMQRHLRSFLHAGDVVLSDIYTSWSIPIFTGAKIVALMHTPPHVTDNIVRRKDIELFYNPETSNQKRKAILKKYGVTHIVLNFSINGKRIRRSVSRLGYARVFCSESYCIFSKLH